MAFNVTEFRSNMIGDGARPNLFSVALNFPTIVTGNAVASSKTTFMAKASQLPGSTLGTVPVFYFGRELKFAGNRTFPDWSVQIINDEDFTIRNAMESWMNAINSHVGNKRNDDAQSPTSYTADATVTQYAKNGDAIKTYRFVGLFPTDIEPIGLDWGTNDSIEEYGITFAYQWWEAASTS
ncbi:MAG: hypothetical protein EBW68_10235 [Actinobacteria bacterium]|nr:hypothetical protein [Actinomycetota bacterium]